MEVVTEVQLTVKFTTKLPEGFQVAEQPIAVPAASKRVDLSKLVNRLLSLEAPRPFDFVVEGRILRTPLHEHFAQRGLSVERVVEIEYIPLILPEKALKTERHDDWISSIDSSTDTVLSASYDGTVKGWTHGLECLWSVAAHEHPVTQVTHVSGESMFLTSSQDGTTKAWILDEESTVPSCVATLMGHSDSVSAVSASPDGQRCCSVGWDSEIRLWPCGAALRTPSEAPAKRKKTEAKYTHPNEITSLGQIEGHTGYISDVLWQTSHRIFTSGSDHTIQCWDITTGSSTESLTTQRVVQCIDAAPHGAPVIAFGSTDFILRLWDARAKSDPISLQLYRSHGGGIHGVAWSQISDYHVATASYDTTIRLWDIRSSVPLVSCSSHSEKCFTVDWCSDWSLLSGGADCELHLHDVQPSVM